MLRRSSRGVGGASERAPGRTGLFEPAVSVPQPDAELGDAWPGVQPLVARERRIHVEEVLRVLERADHRFDVAGAQLQ